MRVRRRLVPVLGAAALFVAGASLASCGGDDQASDTTTETTETTGTTQTTETTQSTETTQPDAPTVVRIRVVNGAPRGGIVRETVDQGDRVVLVVSSDVADHIHLHGYDLIRDVAAGGTARIRFRATVPGRFEVELEDRGVPIADITVEP